MNKEVLSRIVASFTRAFIGGLTASQAINLNDLRGWKGVAGSALVAGIAAALRAAEAAMKGSKSDVYPEDDDE